MIANCANPCILQLPDTAFDLEFIHYFMLASFLTHTRLYDISIGNKSKFYFL